MTRPAQRSATYGIGIDLGTTHSVLAAVAIAGFEVPEVVPVRQRIAEDHYEARSLLPSFLLFHEEAKAWDVGVFARNMHATAPERVVASSKSWLTEPRVDRTSAFLPLATDLDLESAAAASISPTEAQSLILRTMQTAWNSAHSDAPFADQAVVVTIPASFDPFARELVLTAARALAPLATLLEEPTAALLHGAAELSPALRETVAAKGSALVLVADIGGGTSDFALVRVLNSGSQAHVFERIATGRHLLLGGDNIDLALAHRVSETHETLRNIGPRAFSSLVSECRRAKENLLGDESLAAVDIRVVLPGSKLIGGLRTGAVTRELVNACVLHEFFPLPHELTPKPARSAFLGFGLSYERDVAITRHAFEFVDRHRALLDGPLFVLPNGGTLKPPVLGQRLASALEAFGVAVAGILTGDAGDVAVALGAASHARALFVGKSLLRGKVTRNLFLRVDGNDGRPSYVCVLPSGSPENENTALPIDDLALRTGERARFELAWTDGVSVPLGALADELQQEVDALPALVVAVPSASSATVPVAVTVRLDELGCVHLTCVSPHMAQPLFCTFETRARTLRKVRQARLDPGVVRGVEAALSLINDAFPRSAGDGTERAAKDLWRTLEGRFGPRKTWSISLCRALCDVVTERAKGRRSTADHERVFWQVVGFTLRPGTGANGDDERIDRLFRLEQDRVLHAQEARVWEAYFHAWRRVSLGLDARRQGLLFERGELALTVKRQKKACPHAFDASLAELCGHLDRVEPRRRAVLGDAIFDRCMAGETAAHWSRCLGLVGEREPFPAGHDQALPSLVVERWCELALRENWSVQNAWIDAVGRMARLTGDLRRDVSQAMRARLIDRLRGLPSSPAAVSALDAITHGAAPSLASRIEAGSDDLPLGLLLDP